MTVDNDIITVCTYLTAQFKIRTGRDQCRFVKVFLALNHSNPVPHRLVIFPLTSLVFSLFLQWHDILQETPPIMFSSVLCHYGLFMCAHNVCVVVVVVCVCFIAPCGKGSGCGGRQATVTPFPPDSFPVPSTAAVVQPVSDLCCVHTDTDTHRINTHVSQIWLHMYTLVTHACSLNKF